MKISRLLAIMTVLLNREKVTSAELAQRFEVSIRTIIRDMQTISEAGIPIVSYQGYEGGYGLVEGYKVDKHLMNSEEMSIVISVLKGMENAIGNSSIRNLIDKFECLTQKSETSERIQVDLTPWGVSNLEKEKLTLLNKALQTNHVIKISYIDRTGHISERVIEPLMLGLKMSTWYLYSFCRERKDFRLFKVTRIQRISIQDTEFIRKTFDSALIFADESTQQTVHLKLKFASFTFDRVLSCFYTDKMEFQSDGSFLVEVDYPEDEWVYYTLLGFGAQVEVLEPTHIREIIYQRAKEIVDRQT